MPLELRIEKRGQTRCVRPFWYGRFEVNGDRQCLNLGIKVREIAPASLSLKDLGDMDFERSREAARVKLDSVIEEARTKQGSGIENTLRYNEGIYFQQDKSLWVNLYIPSELDWREAGLVVCQEGDSTRDEPVRFTVLKAGKQTSTLNFRIPLWISGSAVLALNGKVKEREGKPSTYLSLKRKWKQGDVVTLTLPAALRLERAKDNSSTVYVFYGPVLLAGELGRDHMPSSD